MFTNRIEKIKKQMVMEKMDGVLITSVSNIIYLTGYSGFSYFEREAFLFITKNAQYILTDGRYSEAVIEKIPHFSLIEITSATPLKTIFQDLAAKHSVKKLGIEEDSLTAAEYKRVKKYFSVKDFSTTSLRIIKEDSEVEKITSACELGDKTFEHILTLIKPGVYEKELGFEIEHFIKTQGADTSFPPIVAFGKNASVPHHQTGSAKLEKKDEGQFILLDFGVKLNNYCSDMTRTVVFGKATEKQKDVYNTVYEAQKRAIEYISLTDNPSAKKADEKARDYITKNGYPSIPHSLGHGTGIEVHEAPRLSPISKDTLKPGMVFSVEPGIYIPGWGGVRIEDLVWIGESVMTLTNAPKNLIEI